MSHEVEKVMCRGCGVQVPEDAVNGLGLCQDCVQVADNWGKDMGSEAAANLTRPTVPELGGGRVVVGVDLASGPDRTHYAIHPPAPDKAERVEAILRAWPLSYQPRLELEPVSVGYVETPAKARKRERTRVALIRAEALIIRRGQQLARLRVTWALIHSMRDKFPQLAEQYEGQRASEVEDILGLLYALRLVRRKLAKLNRPEDDQVDAVAWAFQSTTYYRQLSVWTCKDHPECGLRSAVPPRWPHVCPKCGKHLDTVISP